MTKGCYNIFKNSTFGRYMVAGKNIKAGELILSEKATLLGPQLNGPLICFNCCRHIRNTGYVFCGNCKTAIICREKCTGRCFNWFLCCRIAGYLHSPEECSVLKDININTALLVENDQIIFPLRCLLFKKYKPIIWEAIMELEPHLEHRRDTPIWRRHKVTVEQILRQLNFISEEEVKDELVQRICGVLDVNTFEVRPPQSSTGMITNPEVQCLRGLYLEAALMAHDCVGNTHLSVDEDFVLTIHASVDIPENYPIFFNYSNALHGNILRKQHLMEGKYFECSCQRCRDPTELGTELSSLRCHKCKNGLIRLKDVENVNLDWECSGCKHIFKNCLINSAVREGKRRIDDVDPTDIADMENLLHKLLQTFHPNHYLILELQQNMAGLYVRLPPNKNNLLRKIALCRSMLEILPKIEPGLSRMKAITLYQLQSALIDIAHKQYRGKEINAEELIVKLLSAETTLKEAIQHLLYEPSKSPEGRLAQMALSELKILRTSLTNIQKDYYSAVNDSKKLKHIKTKDGDIKFGSNTVNNTQTKEENQHLDSNLDITVTKSNRRKRNKKKK